VLRSVSVQSETSDYRPPNNSRRPPQHTTNYREPADWDPTQCRHVQRCALAAAKVLKALVTTTVQLRFDCDSTAVRLPFDRNSTGLYDHLATTLRPTCSGLLNTTDHRRSPHIRSLPGHRRWPHHYRSSNPNLSPNPNPNPLTRTLTLILTPTWTVHLRWSAVIRQTAAAALRPKYINRLAWLRLAGCITVTLTTFDKHWKARRRRRTAVEWKSDRSLIVVVTTA